MPTVTIDGRLVEVPAGTNLIEAAKKARGPHSRISATTLPSRWWANVACAW